MKGLMNNEEAVRVFHNIKDSMINPIHHIYNLGYKEGYKDGVEEATRRIAEYVNGTMERRSDESNTERD